MQLHRLEPVPPARLELQRAPPNLMSEAEAATLLCPRPEGCGDLGVCVTRVVVVDCGPGEACAEFGPTATHPSDIPAWAERFRHVAERAGLFAPEPSVETPLGAGFEGRFGPGRGRVSGGGLKGWDQVQARKLRNLTRHRDIRRVVFGSGPVRNGSETRMGRNAISFGARVLPGRQQGVERRVQAASRRPGNRCSMWRFPAYWLSGPLPGSGCSGWRDKEMIRRE